MKLIVNPTDSEPITLDTAKEYLQVDGNHDDPLLSRLIKASRQYIETVCGISIIEKQIELETHDFDSPYLLPYGPVKSATVLQVDGSDVELTGDYVHNSGSVLIAEYTTGYDTLPEDLETAIIEVLKIYYDARGTNTEIPVFLQHKLNLYSRNLYI